MKFIKIISRILLIVLCVSLVGCNQTNPVVIGEISESEETTRLVSETSNDRVIIVCPITYSFLSITDVCIMGRQTGRFFCAHLLIKEKLG